MQTQQIIQKIKSRIENYNTTLSEIIKANEKTQWHNKQIDLLNSRISELNWLLETLENSKIQN